MAAEHPSSEEHEPTFTFDKILNFRDVGRQINSSTQTSEMKERVLFRSARPDNASEKDRHYLTTQLRIKTIVDLRSKSEHINQAKKRDPSVASSSVVPQTDSAISASIKIPGIKYLMVNLNGGGFERALLWKLSWTSLGKLVGLMAVGHRTEAIYILGSEVMQPRGLTALGMDTLDSSGKEIRQIFEILAEPLNYPLMIHCTQGKDRTGIIVVLVLLLAHVDPRAICDDYLLSEPELLPEKAERMEDIKAVGLSEDFAGCPTDFVSKIEEYIERKYGGVEGYLARIGVSTGVQKGVLHSIELTHSA